MSWAADPDVKTESLTRTGSNSYAFHAAAGRGCEDWVGATPQDVIDTTEIKRVSSFWQKTLIEFH